MTTTTARARRRRAEDGRRAELIDAAGRVIAREGVAAATTRRIAQEAGLPAGLVHYWFLGKDELLEEVAHSALRQLEEAIGAASVNAQPRTAQGLLAEFRAAFAVVEADEPGRQLALYELTIWALRAPHLHDLARRQYAAFRATAAEHLRPWLAGTSRDLPGGTDTLSALVAALFDGVILAWLADPEGTKPDEVFALASELLARAATEATALAQDKVPRDSEHRCGQAGT